MSPSSGPNSPSSKDILHHFDYTYNSKKITTRPAAPPGNSHCFAGSQYISENTDDKKTALLVVDLNGTQSAYWVAIY